MKSSKRTRRDLPQNSKTGVGVTPPWVRIPPSPLIAFLVIRQLMRNGFCHTYPEPTYITQNIHLVPAIMKDNLESNDKSRNIQRDCGDLMTPDATRSLLRHLVATLAYRSAKVLRDVPPGFAQFSIGPTTRTPVQILAHLADLMAWGLRAAQGEYLWRADGTDNWDTELHRFFDGLAELDRYLASD